LAVHDWLQGYDVNQLYEGYAFVDREKRLLETYRREGRETEAEFILSWDSIELLNKMFNFPQIPHISEMIAKMREKEYDKRLRAGQSLYTLILSRSQEHGLRDGQPYIRFEFEGHNQDDGLMDVYLNIDKEEKFSGLKIEYTPQLDALLKQLEAQDID
jgi:hypothetical protein